MEKQSGVYLTLTDKSFLTDSGTSVMRFMVPMLLTKGQIGLNRVTANNYEEIVGYNLSYNSNYYGLRQLLENVTYVDVWRLNQGATVANAVVATTSASTINYVSGAETFDEVTTTSHILALGRKSAGDPTATSASSADERNNLYARIVPVSANQTVINSHPTTTHQQTITIPNCNTTLVETVGTTPNVLSSGKVYDSSGNTLVGVVVKTGTSTYSVKKVNADGTIDTEVGNATAADGTITIILSSPFSGDSFWNVKSIPATITDWTLSFAEYNGSVYSIIDEFEFSTDLNADTYWKNLDFGEYAIDINGNLTGSTTIELLKKWNQLMNGSNGNSVIDPSLIDTSVIDTSSANIMLMNGITSAEVVNRFVPKCEKKKIHIFADAPAEKSYASVEIWAKTIAQSAYVSIGARPDQFTYNGKTCYLYPSVNYGLIFARMYQTYGNLNYPPAGASYGTITANDLLECDYDMYGDELKTNRINWQVSNNIGTMMWEQRTTYALNSDLSYIAPVFIIDSLSETLVNFERNYNFRYMSSDDLMNQQSGLNTILQNYVDGGFLYNYQLKVPTFAEAQAAGRVLNIHVEVSIMKDSEVINIDLVLNN